MKVTLTDSNNFPKVIPILGDTHAFIREETMTTPSLTIRAFLLKLVQHLDIGRVESYHRQLVPHEHLTDEEMMLWITIHEQYDYLLKLRGWKMRNIMTPARVMELDARMHQAFRDQMGLDVDRNDYKNLKCTKSAHATWKDTFRELTEQYALA